jgi:endogenous inhibitor of DNA gyrase (YacG/DUF329 family)
MPTRAPGAALEEATMQKRYCTCGTPLVVAYRPFKRAQFKTQFLALNSAGILSVRVCPGCGKPIDIDSLR